MAAARLPKKGRLAFAAFAGFALVSARAPSLGAKPDLLAGAARVEITPAVDALSPPFTKVHDPVYVRALVVDGGGQRAVLVVADVPMIAAPIMRSLVDRIAQRAAVPASHVMLAATHTHGTWRVDTSTYGIFLPGSPRFVETVSTAALDAVDQALAARRPARMALGQGEADLVANRNQWSARLGRYIDGIDRTGDEPIDRTLRVASFIDAEGRPIAFLLNYAIEPIVAMAMKGAISGDVPGYTERYVEERAGQGTVALFTVSAAGSPRYRVADQGEDTSEYRPADPAALIAAMGTILGEEALATAQDARISDTSPAIGALARRLTCPGKRTSPLNLASQCAHSPDSTLPACTFTDSDAPPVDLAMGALRIGNLFLITADANVTPALGRKFARSMPVRDTWLVATSYGPVHYVVDDAAYPLNTYEATASTAKRGCAETGFLDGASAMEDGLRGPALFGLRSSR